MSSDKIISKPEMKKVEIKEKKQKRSKYRIESGKVSNEQLKDASIYLSQLLPDPNEPVDDNDFKDAKPP